MNAIYYYRFHKPTGLFRAYLKGVKIIRSLESFSDRIGRDRTLSSMPHLYLVYIVQNMVGMYG